MAVRRLVELPPSWRRRRTRAMRQRCRRPEEVQEAERNGSGGEEGGSGGEEGGSGGGRGRFRRRRRRSRRRRGRSRRRRSRRRRQAAGRRSPRRAESVASAGRLRSGTLIVACGSEIPRAARKWFWWGCPDRIQRTRKSQDSIFADCGGSCPWQARYGAPHERMVAIPCHSGMSVIPAGQH